MLEEGESCGTARLPDGMERRPLPPPGRTKAGRCCRESDAHLGATAPLYCMRS